MAAVKAIELHNMDTSTSPRDNFYQYANGGWLKKNDIPPEYSRWGTFEELNEQSMLQLRRILDDCISDTDTTNANKKAIATMYSTGMNESQCESFGLSPISDILESIQCINKPNEIIETHAKMQKQMGVHAALFRFSSIPDAKNSSWEVVALSQSSALGMGDRDFYFREDKEELRKKYVQHVENVLSIVKYSSDGEDSLKDLANEMMELECKLANSCMTKTERRDPDKTYNKFNGSDDLITNTSSDTHEITWKKYFSIVGLEEEALETIIVDNPSFFKTLADEFHNTKLSTWKAYLTFHVVKSLAEYLNKEVENEHFQFFSKSMTGQQEMKPRWKRVLQNGVTHFLEDSLGMLYTSKHFTSHAKKACLDLVNILIDEWKERIQQIDWMKDETKEKALLKLSKFRPMIGYPNKWDIDDIPDLLSHISIEKSYCENARACSVRLFGKVVERIHKSVDPDRWEMPATLVNAYFHPLKNVIVFPAAILQPPFFYHPTPKEPYGDVAINFAAIGAVICHEISHGYDDQGRKFDANGELIDWWTEDDANEYEKRASKMEKLCSDAQIFGKNLNGKLCLGENIADYGGVKLAYRGLKKFQQTHGPLPSIDGLTPEQRFFCGWASIWRNNIREENALQRIIMDPHAPGEFRANIVQVIEEFHEAFGVQEGDQMYQPPEARCEIW